jgi:hypothetical protein
MHQFRYENQCQSRSYDSMWLRVRYSCLRRRTKDRCKFMMVAMKTTTEAYHVYKHGEHNHPATKPTSKWMWDEQREMDGNGHFSKSANLDGRIIKNIKLAFNSNRWIICNIIIKLFKFIRYNYNQLYIKKKIWYFLFDIMYMYP